MQQDAEFQKAEDKFQDALQQVENLKFELARETRNRELAEREAQTLNRQVKDLRDENAKVRDDLEKSRAETTDAKIQIAKLEGEKNATEKQREDDVKKREEDNKKREDDNKQLEQQQRTARFQANIPLLMQSLKTFGTVRQNERGIILTLPETYWSGVRVSSFTKTTEPKLSNLGILLAGNPDYKFVVESHTDNKGTPEELQTLTQERAQAIADKLMSLGVDQTRIEARGLGATVPIAANTTNISRAKNRRIELVLVPNLN